MAQTRRTTDIGTVVLHLGIVASFSVLVATGLRIATGDPVSEWLIVLDPILPIENLWINHLLAGVGLAACVAGYAVYMIGARLGARIRLDRARLALMARRGPGRWAAVNVAVFWVLMVALAVEIGTGVALFFGAERLVMAVHRVTTYVCLACVFGHVGLHAAHGGLWQLLRVVRPVPLVLAPPPPDLAELLAEHLAHNGHGADRPGLPPMTAGQAPVERRYQARGSDGPRPAAGAPTLSAHPLASALGVSFLVVSSLLGAEQATRQTLRVREIRAEEAPVLDGDLSDPVWTIAKPVRILTAQGGDFGSTYQSVVEVRAVHDAQFAYFAFVWEDPTRSLKHMPLVKSNGRWQVAAMRDDLSDEQTYNEDKFAVLLTRPGLALIGAAIHLARTPIASRPGSSTGLGLHYTHSGIADVWQWRASHGGPSGHVDNGHFGPAQPQAESRPLDPSAQYSGGYALDPGAVPYWPNTMQPSASHGVAMVVPWRLPRDLAAVTEAMGRVTQGAKASESEGARWWMSLGETVPYTAALDAGIADGTVIPGVIVDEKAAMSPESIRGVARWAAGRWTLEVARRLYTGSGFDVPIKTGVMMWVGAFDHAAKRHTRHLRPIHLEVD